jgi:hypothetical protein
MGTALPLSIQNPKPPDRLRSIAAYMYCRSPTGP